jgi:hypothetical protein
MFNQQDEFFELTDALSALGELEKNTDRAIVAQRASERLDIKCKIVIRAANASERQRVTIEGMTADISNGGCQVMVGRPIFVGDYFLLEFPDETLRIGSTLARCLRCRLIQEDAFEVGFRFEHDIDMQTATSESV